MKHILVLRFSAMGDVAMLCVVLHNFLEQNPNVKITILSKPFLQPIFSQMPRVVFYPIDTQKTYKGICGIYKLYKAIKNLDIDYIADTHNVLRTKILRLFFMGSGIKTAVLDKGRKEKKYLTRNKPKKLSPMKTMHERYADVFRALGFSVQLTKPVFAPKRNIKTIDFFLKNRSHTTKKNIGIAPFASYQSKMYPLDLMEQVVQKLNALDCVHIFLLASQSESHLLKTWTKQYKNVFSLEGIGNFKNELCLIANLDLVLSMDSANGHLSALFGVPTLTLWGGTHPVTGFGTFGQPLENSLLPDTKKYPLLPCSVYGNKVFKGYENAMKSILPEKIIELMVSKI